MARTLVIGGTMFIGRALVKRLLDSGDDVTILHRSDGTPFGEQVREIRCDRNDASAVRAALTGSDFEVVYDNVYDWERGTEAEPVVAAARAAAEGGSLRRYVFTSSVAVYGPGGEFREDDELVPPDHPEPYMRQKAATERALFQLHRDEGIPVSTVRPAFIFGPGNPFPREAFFWDRIVADRPVIVPGDGSRTMQWVHVDDVALALERAAKREVAAGRAYNLGSYPPLTQTEFVETLARAAGRSVRTVHVPREELLSQGGELLGPPLYFGAYLDIPSITANPERAQADLGLAPVALEEGLRATFQRYTEEVRPSPDFSWEDRFLEPGGHGG